MNAAYLLMTTVWLAGADAAPPAHHPAPGPAPAPVVYGGCNGCSSCDTCDDCGGKRSFGDRLRGLFSRKGSDCDSCCETTVTCTPCAPTTCCDSCDSCDSGKGLGGRLRGLFKRNDCDSCDECDGPSLFDRIRGLFRKSDDCCDSCAPPCCGGTHGPVIGGPGGAGPEPIGPPKEAKPLPNGNTSLGLTPITTR